MHRDFCYFSLEYVRHVVENFPNSEDLHAKLLNATKYDNSAIALISDPELRKWKFRSFELNPVPKKLNPSWSYVAGPDINISSNQAIDEIRANPHADPQLRFFISDNEPPTVSLD